MAGTVRVTMPNLQGVPVLRATLVVPEGQTVEQAVLRHGASIRAARPVRVRLTELPTKTPTPAQEGEL